MELVQFHDSLMAYPFSGTRYFCGNGSCEDNQASLGGSSDQFSQKNVTAIYQIQKSIASITQGTMSVASYYIKIKALWDELEMHHTPMTCNNDKEHQQE